MLRCGYTPGGGQSPGTEMEEGSAMQARMMGAQNPGYRRTCAKKHVRRGCRCFVFGNQHGGKAKRLRRRAQRAQENRTWQ